MVKLIQNKSDKAQLTVFVAGLIGLARIFSGKGPGLHNQSWLKGNKELADEYVDQIIESEKVPEEPLRDLKIKDSEIPF